LKEFQTSFYSFSFALMQKKQKIKDKQMLRCLSGQRTNTPIGLLIFIGLE